MSHRSSLASSDQNAPSLVVPSVVVSDDGPADDPRVGPRNACIGASVIDTG